MDIGLIFTGADMTMAELTAIGRRAEQSGVASLYLAEAWRSGWVPLTALAAATSRVRLGPYVLNAYGRSPLLAGMSAIDFNDFSHQRLVLGVGGGNRTINEQWQGIPHARVLTKMAEYVTLMQRMARTRLGETLDFEGKIHRMHWSPAVDPGDRPFPVYLAAVFPRMLKVAGRVADGIACGATLSVDYLRDVVRPQVIDAATTAGRDPSAIAWTAVHFIAVDEDRARARRAAREAICHLYAPLPHPYYEYTMREQGFGAAADAALTHMPAGNLDAAVAAIPDECIDRLVIAGTQEDCRARIAAYEGVVDEIVLLNALPAGDAGVEESYASLMQLVESHRNQAT